MARLMTMARRYAEAAFQIAQRDGTVEQWLEQLEEVGQVARDPQAVRRLEDPAVPLDVRQEALLGALHVDTLPQVRNLLSLILRRRRVEMLGQIGREFRRLYNRQAGITEATAISATELSAAEVRALRERVERMAGGRVELTFEVEPALLGGVQLRLGDRLIDGSVRGRLERLRNELTARA
ncbi:F0F1 ATP synthase subunit delta [soil metagenome]